MKGVSVLLVGALLSPFATAQQTRWGQCGGINWAGPKTCVGGTYCKHWNDFYYQCIPGEDGTQSASCACTCDHPPVGSNIPTTLAPAPTSTPPLTPIRISTTAPTGGDSTQEDPCSGDSPPIGDYLPSTLAPIPTSTPSLTPMPTPPSEECTEEATYSSNDPTAGNNVPPTLALIKTQTPSRTSNPTPATPHASASTASTSTTPPSYPAPTAKGGNPFDGKTQWANPHYASLVLNTAVPSLVAAGHAALASKAADVAKVPSFVWLAQRSDVPLVKRYLQMIKDSGAKDVIAPFVVYNLPNRDCASFASSGELSATNGGVDFYKQYIDDIKASLQEFPDIPVALVIEPDALGNLITNMNVPECAAAADAYKTLVIYACKALALPNVTMYLDGTHSGWLGWPNNIGPAATMYGTIYKDSGSPKQLRGLAINVANYNPWSVDTCLEIALPNVNCDEKKYINAIAPLLEKAGWKDPHFVIDQGRSGRQPTGQIKQADWCNILGTGFGMRPGTPTGDPLVDAIAWIKPGGQSDGTSDTSAARFDSHCGLEDSLKPAPEAGLWFQAYFEQLLVNANPSF